MFAPSVRDGDAASLLQVGPIVALLVLVADEVKGIRALPHFMTERNEVGGRIEYPEVPKIPFLVLVVIGRSL